MVSGANRMSRLIPSKGVGRDISFSAEVTSGIVLLILNVKFAIINEENQETRIFRESGCAYKNTAKEVWL